MNNSQNSIADPLVWGMRVQVGGKIGVYEGLFTADRPNLLRIRFTDEKGWTGVCAIERDEVCAIPEHGVVLRRRLKRSGAKPNAERHLPVPVCYEKDYGKTALERATDAWLAADPGTEESLHLCGEMMRLNIAEMRGSRPRRLHAADVAHRRDAERVRAKRQHRIRQSQRKQVGLIAGAASAPTKPPVSERDVKRREWAQSVRASDVFWLRSQCDLHAVAQWLSPEAQAELLLVPSCGLPDFVAPENVEPCAEPQFSLFDAAPSVKG